MYQLLIKDHGEASIWVFWNSRKRSRLSCCTNSVIENRINYSFFPSYHWQRMSQTTRAASTRHDSRFSLFDRYGKDSGCTGMGRWQPPPLTDILTLHKLFFTLCGIILVIGLYRRVRIYYGGILKRKRFPVNVILSGPRDTTEHKGGLGWRTKDKALWNTARQFTWNNS